MDQPPPKLSNLSIQSVPDLDGLKGMGDSDGSTCSQATSNESTVEKSLSLRVILASKCTLTYPVVVDIPPKCVVHRECLQTRTQSTSLQKK